MLEKQVDQCKSHTTAREDCYRRWLLYSASGELLYGPKRQVMYLDVWIGHSSYYFKNRLNFVKEQHEGLIASVFMVSLKT